MKKILLLAFCLAGAGCSLTNTQNAQQTASVQTGDFGSVSKVQTGNSEQEPIAKQEKPLLIGQSTGDAKNTLIDFYNNIGEKNFKGSLGLFDEGMLKIPNISEYFNEIRLNRFVSALDGGMTLKNIIQTPEDQIHDPTRDYKVNYRYDLIYGIGGTLYVETRSMGVKFDSQKNLFSIVSLMCQKNCGRYPFFNLDKFGIK